MQRAAHGCGSVQEVVAKLTMAKFLTLYSPDVANYVQLQDPRTVGEAANLVQEYYQRQQSRDHRRPYSQKPWMRSYDRSAGGFRDDKPRADADGANREADKPGEVPRFRDSYKGNARAGTRHGSGNGQGEHREERDWVPTCCSCGKKGHKRPECPDHRIGRVVSPVRQAALRVDGHVGEHECQMTIDTGAQKNCREGRLGKTRGVYWGLHQVVGI